MTLTQTRKLNPRKEHQLQQAQRMEKAATLLNKFPNLKSLTVNLLYFDPTGLMNIGEVKYSVNLTHAKSMFAFACRNAECAYGDFDLSPALASAIRSQNKKAEGEVRCPGTRSRPRGETCPCGNVLRFKLTLGYV